MKCLALVVLNLLAYWRTLDFHYIIDDLSVFKAGQSGTYPRPGNGWLRFLKQAVGLGYWDTKQSTTFRESTNRQAHGTVLIIHTVACLLIYVAFGSTPVAFLAAVLFSLCPVNQQVSIWLSGKCYGYGSILTLLYIWGWRVLPVWGRYIEAVFILWTINAVAAWFAKGIKDKLPGIIKNKEALCLHPRKCILLSKFLGYYFADALFAHNLAFYHSYQSEYLYDEEHRKEAYRLDPYFFIGVLVIAYLGFGLAYHPASVFGLAWFVVLIAPFCHYISFGQQHISLRYCYLPNIGLMLWLAGLCVEVPWLAGAWLAWYAARLFSTMNVFKNDFWDCTYQIVQEPEYFYSWLLHGNRMFARGHFGVALQDYIEGRNFHSKSFKIWFNMSSAYVALGDLTKAVICLEEAKKMEQMGQEISKETWISEREVLIGRLFQFAQRREKVKLTVEQIPLIV